MATREEIFTAIRNADAAGDSAAVRKLGEYLKTLPADAAQAAPADPASIPGSPENRAMHQARLSSIDQQIADEKAPLNRFQRFNENLFEAGKDVAKAGPELLATLGSQVVAAPVAGLTGLVTAPLGFVPGMEGVGDRNVERASRALTYEPSSDAGKAAVETFSKPFTWFAGKADQAGDVVNKVTGSPALAAATNTAIQAVPMFLTKGGRAPVVSAGRAAAGALRTGEEAAAAANAARASTATVEADSTAQAAAKAQDYARSIGLDWNALAGEIKGKLTDIAKSSGELENLDPVALKRAATLQGLKVPVPATRGAITRDTQQLLNEDVAKSTREGAPIRAIADAGDNALQANLDVLKGRVSGTGKSAATATNREQAGRVVQGAARGKEAVSKANYDRLYKIARETEPDARAPLSPVTDLLQGNPEIQHLGWVQTWLNKAAKLAGGKEGEPVALTDASLAELSDLRSQASGIAGTGGKEGYYARQVTNAIDNAMEAVPAGSKAWKAARDAFKAHKTEFADQGAVADLVDNSTRTDRATALEKTADTIANGSLEDIRKVKRSLLTGGDESTRTAGKQAWREVRAQVVDRIKREATKSATEKADGTPQLSVARLKQVIDAYGPEKLDEIFGPGNAKEVYRILDAAKIVKTMPPNFGSNTANKLAAFLSKGLEKIPFGGKAVDIARGVGKVKEIGANARAVESANRMPLNEALELAKAKAKGRASRAQFAPLKTTPLSSLSAGANQK